MGSVSSPLNSDITMLPNQIDSGATLVRHQYGLFIGAATGAFGRALDSSDPTTKHIKKRMAKELRDVFSAASFGIGRVIENSVKAISASAIEDCGCEVSQDDRAAIAAYCESSISEGVGQVTHCLHKDSQMTLGALHRLSLLIELRSSHGSVGKVTAIIGARFGAIDKLKFHQRDRIGRKYVSDAFVYAQVRKVLLDTYLWVRLYAQARAGNDLARVVNPGKESDGMIFSITGKTPDYPSFVDIQEQVFHPRTSASVEAVTL